MNELAIYYKIGNGTFPQGKGEMHLSLDFFPCKVQTARKLFKLVAQHCNEDVITEFGDYLKSMIDQTDNDRLTYAKKAVNIYTNDLEYNVKRRKHSNGVYMTKKELEEAKTKLKRLKTERSSYIKKMKEAEKKNEGYTKNLEILNSCLPENLKIE